MTDAIKDTNRIEASGPVIFIFLDGVGLGDAGEHNPLAGGMPWLEDVAGAPLLASTIIRRPDFLLSPLDATLGVPGLPQSATGQTSLYTGINAPDLLQSHFSPFPTTALRNALETSSFLLRVQAKGARPAFANAYGAEYLALLLSRKRRSAAGLIAAQAAGVYIRNFVDLQNGEALFWDLTHAWLAGRYAGELPLVDPAQAARRLLAISVGHDLTFYELFLTDYLGHARDFSAARQHLHDLDRFLQTLVEEKSATTTIVVSSDHGNIEDLRTKKHTLNPVPLLVCGPGAPAFAGATSLLDVAAPLVTICPVGPI